jgi:GAF domain-containing protein
MLGTYLDITDQVKIKNETREYAEQLEALHEVTGVVSASLSLEEVLDIILDQLSETLDFVSASIFLIKEKGLEIVTVKNHRHPELVLGKTFPLDNPLFQEMMAAKKPIIIDNAQRDKRFQAWGQTDYVRGWMGIPLVVREQLIGYITLDSEQTSAFGNPESKLAEIFATQAAQAIENAQLYQQIQQYADELEERIEKRTKELSRMVDLMAGREIRMKELKEVIRTLRAQILHAGLDPEADDPLLE